MKKLLLSLCALTITSCAAFDNALSAASEWDDQYGEGLWDMAQMACARQYARARAIDLDEAKDKFCATAEQLEPWKDALLRAERVGAGRAGIED